MTTKFIGVKEFRQNMAKLATRARKNSERLIILRKNEPIFEIRPLSKSDAVLEELLHDITKAKGEVKKGLTYSQEEIETKLGL